MKKRAPAPCPWSSYLPILRSIARARERCSSATARRGVSATSSLAALASRSLASRACVGVLARLEHRPAGLPQQGGFLTQRGAGRDQGRTSANRGRSRAHGVCGHGGQLPCTCSLGKNNAGRPGGVGGARCRGRRCGGGVRAVWAAPGCDVRGVSRGAMGVKVRQGRASGATLGRMSGRFFFLRTFGLTPRRSAESVTTTG